jgi:hypothetical protein
MDKKQLEMLDKVSKPADTVFTAEHLNDKTDRTLLYGYTCDRASWHVYIKDGNIHTVMYFSDKDTQEIFVQYNHDFVPDKRLYPECCDFEFCALLKRDGCSLPFTNFQDRPVSKTFWGNTL